MQNQRTDLSSIGIEASLNDEDEFDDSNLDVFSLNRVPPLRTNMMEVKFKYIGRGKPMPHQLDDDLLDD